MQKQSWLKEYVKDFRPSLYRIAWESWYQAKGMDRRGFLHYGIFGLSKCFICGREEDLILNSVKLIPYFDIPSKSLVRICTDHGRVTEYNCVTGLPIQLPLPTPYWHRHIRDTIWFLTLRLVIYPRFVWFFIVSVLMWYILLYPHYWFRKLQRCLKES